MSVLTPAAVLAQSAMRPTAIAVTDGVRTLTYAQAVAAALRVAEQMRGAGIAHEDRIALPAERCIDAIVCMLGVMLAGAAFVPIAFDAPEREVDRAMSDAGVRRVVAWNDRHEKTSRRRELPVTRLGALGVLDETPQRSRSSLPEDGAALAYVLFTSGSSGGPKGVAVEHHALAAHLTAVGRIFGLQPTDRVFQFASLSFDASIQEILAPLTHGATVIVWPTNEPWSMQQLLRFCDHQRVSVLNIPTAVWHKFIVHRRRQVIDIPTSVRLVVVGGERLSNVLTAEWVSSSRSDARVVDMYGPTEATISVTCADVRTDWDWTVDPPTPTIGRPFPNVGVEVRAVDDGRLVPIGEDGELWLSGATLAREYIGRPGLTRSRFPYVDGRRRHRTGDVVRETPDGRLVFVGRVDDQVKVRGHRLHLSDVEEAFRSLDAIADAAVVTVASNGDEHAQLAAFVVPSVHDLTASEARTALKPAVPSWMLPASVIVVERLPRTATGKVDRALLSRKLMRRSLPQTEPKLTLVDQVRVLMAEALCVRTVAATDDFFARGGDSLAAIHLLTALEDLRGVEMPFRSFFADPTAQGVAAYLNAEDGRLHSAPSPRD
jgi:amino acid adenylation domain-containing protein